jgi:hypothetical protein
VKTAEQLREKARRYREMRRLVTDQRLIDALSTLADEYEALATKLDGEALGNSDGSGDTG